MKVIVGGVWEPLHFLCSFSPIQISNFKVFYNCFCS